MSKVKPHCQRPSTTETCRKTLHIPVRKLWVVPSTKVEQQRQPRSSGKADQIVIRVKPSWRVPHTFVWKPWVVPSSTMQ